jgi:1-acyl-sn-glycerol-3-phosphate acyltransferase
MRRAFLAFARWWIRRRARVDLDGVHVAGLDRTRALLRTGSVVMAANHVGWWDGPCMVLVDAAISADGHFVLEAASLRRFPFFRWLGAIPLAASPVAMRAAFRACDVALSAPGRALWFFPQGREQPSWIRPLGFRPGVSLVGRSAAVVPVAIAYAWRGGSKPAAFLHLGTPVSPAALEAAVERGLEEIDRCLMGDERAERFECVVEGGAVAPQESVWTRMLASVSRA